MTSLLVLTAGLLWLVAMGLAGRSGKAQSARAVAVFAILLATLCLAPTGEAADGLLRQDGFSACWQLIFLLAALPLAMLMPMEDESSAILLLGSLAGMSLLASANHLILLFIGLESMSLPGYLLVYRLNRGRDSLEAAIKYFFMGSAAAALYLFGASLYYGATGSLALAPAGPSSFRLEFSLALMAVAALLKIGAVPLHFWLPDVYEASAPELAGFFSTAFKAAGILFLLRLLQLPPVLSEGMQLALPWISAVTMTVGNFLALRQSSLARLLAYSSIAHVGYLLLGVWAWTRDGRPLPGSILLYLAAYLFMSTGAFAALRLSGLKRWEQLRGYGARSPWLAGFMALMLLSLASIPPTGGFLAKFFIFWDALRAQGAGWVWVAAFNSLVGIGYYFSWIKAMAFDPADEQAAPPAPKLSLRQQGLLWGCAVPTLFLGVWPGVHTWLTALLGAAR